MDEYPRKWDQKKKLQQTPFALPTRSLKLSAIFTDSVENGETGSLETRIVKATELGLNILRHVIWSNAQLNFRNLKSLFPSARNMTELLTNPKLIPSLEVAVSGTRQQLESLSLPEKHLIASHLIQTSLLSSIESETKYNGSEVFLPKLLGEIFNAEKILKIEANSERSKKLDDIDLENTAWFAQNEIWGTSEEKNLIRFMKNAMSDLSNKFETILLIRNEMHFPIYAFADGAAFYPDFVLIASTKNLEKKIHYQVFIEPKGDQFVDAQGTFSNGKEGWKQDFLDEISIRSDLLLEDSNYKLIGLPFFNTGSTYPDLNNKFSEAFRAQLQ